MTTAEINAQRNHLFRGEFATELVAAVRERLQAQPRRKRPRIVAIGRSVAGQSFQVTVPPIDFAEAVAEVDSRTPVQWTAAQHDEIDGEHVGEDVARQPWLY